MQICFDIETPWYPDFKYGWLTSYEDAWKDVAALSPTVIAATAFLPESNQWMSFRRSEIRKLCTLVAKADLTITFNGKCWDIPVIGQQTPAKTVISKLKKLSTERAQRHDDLCQKVPGYSLWRLFILNFGQAATDQWSDAAKDYKYALMDRGWTNEEAFKASNAYRDVGMTFGLWKQWRDGCLITH